MLSPDEQKQIHKTIAVQMLGKGEINASDVDTIMMHAIAGKSPNSLAVLAQRVLSADSRTLEKIAEHLSLFRILRTEVPIYREDPSVSGTLRIAQFRLTAASGEENKISEVSAALFDEVDGMLEGEPKRVFEAAAVNTVLGTIGIANYLDNWIALLLRYKTMVETSDFL